MKGVAVITGKISGWFDGLLRRVPVGDDGSARIGARQIYILPTATGVWYGFAVLLMLVGSLNYQNNLGLLFTFFLTSVGIAAMHQCWFNLLGLSLTARPGPAVFAGSAASFEVILRNERAQPRYDLRIDGAFEGGRSVFVAGLEQRELSCKRPTTKRGWLILKELRLETRHPMHLFRAWCYAGTTAVALVYPKPAACSPPATYEGGEGRPRAAPGAEGRDDYLGPRPFRHGDSPRHLDWKALARERGLVVKEFGGENGADLWIDWDRVGERDTETRISLLARQVVEAGSGTQRFGLRLPGVEVGLGTGENQCQLCLRALALWGLEEPAAARRTNGASRVAPAEARYAG